MDPLLQAYLTHVRVEKRLAQRTQTLYTLHLTQLSALAREAGLTLAEVPTTQVRRWAAQMHSAGRQGRGIALVLSCWRSFYTWLGQQGLIASNPVTDVRAPRAPKLLPKALGVDDAVQLADYQNPDDDPWLEARDAALVELLYGSGLRVGELVGLDVRASPQAQQQGRGWIDLQAAEVHVQGKGGKRRSVPIGRQALAALQRWLHLRGGLDSAAVLDQPALFMGRNGTRLTPQSIWQRLRRRSVLAGMPTAVHPHMLRHSFASHVLQSSSDLRAVQELLGHANISTTQVYTRLDFQHLAKAYDAAHPRARQKAPRRPAAEPGATTVPSEAPEAEPGTGPADRPTR
ncbi:tyrosine recombinase XerC [Curvibacter sp. HBC61]|uniref:Tyrosine recombinase XerC n=1 Tax=Curvibacter cyanobacteriorum TaxID=3026422 RepID=A0ABT5N1Q6_9BURK|nr:tyrosine recombinase XerC [Curvibacter sp. HBC61]MDD0839998.1 tyrosine recombinase XerC [Curvibacter sp. HBC61]